MVDFFWSQVNIHELVFLSLKQSLVVVQLSRQRNAAYYFDLATLVDKNVAGVDVSYLLFEKLEFVASPHDVIQQIPHLGL